MKKWCILALVLLLSPAFEGKKSQYSSSLFTPYKHNQDGAKNLKNAKDEHILSEIYNPGDSKMVISKSNHETKSTLKEKVRVKRLKVFPKSENRAGFPFFNFDTFKSLRPQTRTARKPDAQDQDTESIANEATSIFDFDTQKTHEELNEKPKTSCDLVHWSFWIWEIYVSKTARTRVI